MTQASPHGDADAHQWADTRFELADGHPWVIDTCATCGQERRYRAFERYWDPEADPPPAAGRR